ncbi:histidinol dehydrogenase [Lentibacillus halophilus]|uniref:Histidinol dehydrogenase n=1 Tax=Lentibacillus halophilus TaxID=295065 RepID=A0ABP3IXH8_9BACI
MKKMTASEFRQLPSISSGQNHNQNVDETVLPIISDVQKNGDDALFRLTEKLDGVSLSTLYVTEEEFQQAESSMSDSFQTALKTARQNLETFHAGQLEKSWFMNPHNGMTLGQKVTPIKRVGVYIPGGKASYPSSVLMNIIPAKLAGVEKITITTPPDDQGNINPHVLAAAKEAGVDTVCKVGGAQAIAALAYGTESIEPVSKIVGPGNAYVARTKKWVYGDVDIDMIAGPSEICIVADETANPAFAAADLLSQAEHDEQAKPLLVTPDWDVADAIQKEISNQMEKLDRKAIIRESLNQNGHIIVTETLAEALDTANRIAPEHLQLMIRDPFANMASIVNAGAIFLGNYSPEALGDYTAGPNHTLPTSGTAMFSSPLGVYDFVKKSSIIHYDKNALSQASQATMSLAEAEGLTAHARAIQIRKDEGNAPTND